MQFLDADGQVESGYVPAFNALNVFPVPDGDTGTNMLATLRAAIAEGDATLASGITSIDEVSAAVARGALLGARGNSGVLLSQILRGLPQAVRGRKRARASEIASALSIGALHAYAAVAVPTEGTILTVAREAASAAMQDAESGPELRPFLERIDVPTDIFWGTDDHMTPLGDGALMHEKIRGSRLHTFKHIRHRVHRDKAKEIAEVIQNTKRTAANEG